MYQQEMGCENRSPRRAYFPRTTSDVGIKDNEQGRDCKPRATEINAKGYSFLRAEPECNHGMSPLFRWRTFPIITKKESVISMDPDCYESCVSLNLVLMQ